MSAEVATKMDALRYLPKEGKMALVSVPVPKVEKPNQVLVQVKSSGLCGTDLHIVSGKFEPRPTFDMTLGHEFSGVVAACGKDAARRVKVGMRVGIDPNSYCFACEFCSDGRVNHCERGGTRNGVGVFKNGGFAEFALVDAELCFPLPEDVSFDQGALCEPLSCILHGWNRLQRFGPPQPDSRIVILGAGIIGNLWAAILHHHGLKDVTISEPFEKRREIAKKMSNGTGYKVVTPDEAAAMFPEETCKTEGIDILIDCTGFPPALEKAFKWMKRGGVVCVFGCPAPGAKMSLCPEEIFAKELVIFGAQINPFTYKRAIALASAMGEQYLDLEKLGVQIFKLEEYKVALDMLKEGSISKAMFNVSTS